MGGTFQLKGARLPPYAESKARPPRVEPFVPGRRYPVNHEKALAVIEYLAAELHEDEIIDVSRFTRLYDVGRWELWTTEGRRIDAQVKPDGELFHATISEHPDPNIPPGVR